MTNRFFRDDETLSPRLVVITGVAAFALVFLSPAAGLFLRLILSLVALALLLPLAYSALRALMPMMDPRDPDADRVAVWGGFILMLILGVATYGLIALPALGIACYILWMRAPELLEAFDLFPNREDNG